MKTSANELPFHLEGGVRLLGRGSFAFEPPLAGKAFEPATLEEHLGPSMPQIYTHYYRYECEYIYNNTIHIIYTI